jgi:uncharacterized protein
MQIRVSEIPEEGIQVEGPAALPRPFADPAWKLDALSLHVDKDGEIVLVSGSLRARVPLVCGRCLEPFEMTVEPGVDARLLPAVTDRTEAQVERELGVDDLDTDVYDHGILDVEHVVETETTLALPMKPLCRESCRGLCPICGGNRNLNPCTCEESSPEPRWAPLKKLAERLSQ